jgi:rubrerythrin
MIAALKTRTKGCPYCSNTKLIKGNSFADIHPELMDEYDPENTIDAFSVFPNSKKAVKWICRNNPNHRWEGTFALRNVGSGNCPICNRSKLIKGVNTFVDVYKNYVNIWSPNNDRKADETFYNSSLWFKWICPTCEMEYGAYIKDVVSDKETCPSCIIRPNSLAVIYPEIAKLWSPNNEQQSDRVLPDTNSWAKWICPNCNGEYRALISKMSSCEATCPYCNDRLVLPGFNSFAAKHPDLMSEWEYTNNYLLADPDQIIDNCNLSVWWICPKDKNHEYPMSPSQKLMYQKRHKESCPYCKGLRRKKRHFV